MAKVLKAPHDFDKDKTIIMLYGSIEQGAAEEWQDTVTKELKDLSDKVIILNPRRDSWGKTWDQEKDNPKFKEQVEWELRGGESADLILMYFDPKTKSPITLLELGLFCQDGLKHMIVCCPEGYHRKGNVDIVCSRYGVQQVDTLEELIAAGKRFMEKMD